MRRLALTLFAALSLPLSSTPMRSDPYTPDALLAELQGDFEPWVAARKGQLCLARDPWHFLELLAESPAGWRTVLHWDGEANPGDVPEAGDFCVQRLSLGVTANLGLTAKPDQSLVKATAARPALLQLVAQVRERMRAYRWPEGITQGRALYKGADVIELPGSGGIPLAGYRLNFELLIALPEAAPLA